MKNSKRIENAGCDKCGTLDRMPKSNLCEQCSVDHTPGPWVAKATASLGPQYVVYPEADGPDIAIVYDHGNTEANASLIAAAPELLHAVKHALKLSEATLEEYLDLGEEEDGANVSAERSNIALFMDAIAKAESI